MLVLATAVMTSYAFTATSAVNRSVCGSEMPLVGSSLPSSCASGSIESRPLSSKLMARNDDISSEERGSDNVNNIIGLDRGLYLLAIVLAINVWFFSVPVEFRRTRICNEADSAAYPDRCMTSKQFTTGIKEYYANGKT